MRAQSIQILKEAIQNKTLSCYHPEVNSCRYYHGASQTCCAVGILIPKEQLIPDDSGDCMRFNKLARDSSIGGQMGSKNSLFGLTKKELHRLQTCHDAVIVSTDLKVELIRKLETFINSLQFDETPQP
jgi:hypothetical protein